MFYKEIKKIKKNIFLLGFLLQFILFTDCLAAKIVGLVAARNERLMIKQCLKSLALYVDAIVFLDDASDDDTLAIVEFLKDECKIERIICKQVWLRDEGGDRNLLLQAAREIGGTHFIILDADELLIAPCLKNNLLRNRILQMQPGECLWVRMYNVWRSPDKYRDDPSVWTGTFVDFVFCDDKESTYAPNYFLHAGRSPWSQVSGKQKVVNKVHDGNIGILHFQFTNWRNLLIKQAWYRCLEHIRMPQKSIKEINELYGHSKNEKTLKLTPIPAEWVAWL